MHKHFLKTIFKKEILSFCVTPVAYIYTSIFLISIMAFAFYFGNYFENGVADLSVFFNFMPWIFIFFIPAITMRVWSEEKRSGTIELLITLPVSLWLVVLGKFLATWFFIVIAIILTFPIWITTNYLGNPDNLLIFNTYIGAIFLSGCYVSIGIFFSSITKNQIIAFISSIVICFLFTITGFPLVTDIAGGIFPIWFSELLSSFSFLTHFSQIQAGFFSLQSFVFFTSTIVLWNYLALKNIEN